MQPTVYSMVLATNKSPFMRDLLPSDSKSVIDLKSSKVILHVSSHFRPFFEPQFFFECTVFSPTLIKLLLLCINNYYSRSGKNSCKIMSLSLLSGSCSHLLKSFLSAHLYRCSSCLFLNHQTKSELLDLPVCYIHCILH